MEPDTDKYFFDDITKSVCKNKKIDYIIKVEGWKNLNTDVVEKLSITVLDKKTLKQNIFTIINDTELILKSKLKKILVEAINQKLISKDSVVTFIFDDSFDPDYPFGVLVLEVSKVLYRIARFNLSEFMQNNSVLEKIIDIAQEIKKEGREGKNIGTLIIIGDEEELTPYLSQLVLNPFYGYPEDMRDILNQDLTETIKEYAQLDGAFIVNNKGIVRSAGTYINVDTNDVKKYYGWGTKHLTASAITSTTKSIAVLVSESGNIIKIFKGGKLVLKD